jgi:hypothetical protein
MTHLQSKALTHRPKSRLATPTHRYPRAPSLQHCDPREVSMDDSAPPFGERRLKEIVDHVIAVGDAAESSALEAKVDVDLSEKSGRAKVVKFILGMANRTQRVASARFGGYAVMLIGVEQGRCPGISKGIEGHDLSNAFRPYFGSHTPRWDMDRVPVDGDHEVLVVIVEPPRGGDPIYFCHRSLVVPGSGGRQSELLADGALYLRDKTSTRVATGAEATELSAERGRDASLPADPDLSVVGEAICIADQHDVLNAWVQSSVEPYRTEVKDARAARQAKEAERQPWQLPGTVFGESVTESFGLPSARFATTASSGSAEERISNWEQRTRTNWPNTTRHLLEVFATPVQFTIINPTDSFLKSPQMRIVIDHCDAVDNVPIGNNTRNKILPPVEPKSTGLSIAMPDIDLPNIRPVRAARELSWEKVGTGVVVTLHPETLRSNTPWSPVRNDLILYVQDPLVTELQARWTFTAEGIHGQLTGETTVQVDQQTNTKSARG